MCNMINYIRFLSGLFFICLTKCAIIHIFLKKDIVLILTPIGIFANFIKDTETIKTFIRDFTPSMSNIRIEMEGLEIETNNEVTETDFHLFYPFFVFVDIPILYQMFFRMSRVD